MDYIKFSKGEQEKFLRKVKINSSLTWIEIAKILKVNRSMIYLYLNESCKLPYISFIKLCKQANLNSDLFQFEIILKPEKGSIKIPNKITPKLAGFIGIILGDGHISKLKYEISVTLDSVLDKKYIDKIVKTYFFDLFKKEPSIYYSKSNKGVKCFIYSKKLFYFLTNEIGLPSGNKKYNKNNIMPKIFFKNKILLKRVIRGLFDTEGGFYQHNKTSPRIYIYNTSKPLLDSLDRALKQLGYKSILKKNTIKICKKEEIKRFFKEIGTKDYQKKLKYQIWLKEGKVPKKNRIIAEI
jgi:hypothetical protein